MRKLKLTLLLLLLSTILYNSPVMASGSQTITLQLGTTQGLYCGLHYDDGYDKTWVSSNSLVANVLSYNGANCSIELTGIGKCSIYFSTKYKSLEIINYNYGYPIFGYVEHSDDFTYYITVTNSGAPEVGTIDIGDSLSLEPGDTRIFNVNLKSTDDHIMSNYNQLSWSSSNSSVATVNQIGVIKALTNGNAIITATTPEGTKGNCTVSVTSETEYTKISTVQQLNDIRKNPSGKYILVNNIIFSDSYFSSGGIFYNEGNGWTPIDGFTGILNGNGFYIENINCKSQNAGLFTDLKGEVKNLEIKNSNISGTDYAGAFFASSNEMKLINCKSTGNIITGNYAGGIGGSSDYYGNYFICTNTSTVKGSLAAGGIIGYGKPYNKFLLCTNKGNISSTNNGYSGGIVGKGSQSISLKYCSNEGMISGTYYIGGLVGLCGVYSEIYNSYNTGKIAVNGDSVCIGGIAGSVYTTYIADCYNTGEIELNSGSSGVMGGIVGNATDISYSAGENALMLLNCISSGKLSFIGSGLPKIGGIAGTITGLAPLASANVAKNSYYLDSLCLNGIGWVQYGKTDKILPLTATQMKSSNSFSNFDFSKVWEIKNSSLYPNLRFQDITTNIDISVVTLIGSDRYDTAVKLSQNQFSNADTILIVNGSATADGLGATPLAAFKKAPLLLTDVKTLPSVTVNEIKRLKAKNAIIVGGTGVVSDTIKIALQNMGLTVERISGKNRYITSLEVAKYIDKNCYDINKVAISNGWGEADALSIASVAGRDNMPIILVEKNTIEDITYNWLSAESLENAYIVGGTGVVSDTILSKINNITNVDIKNNRLGGQNRFDTNSIIIDRFYGNSINKIYIAKGYLLIDALSAGPVAALNGSPVVISSNDLSESQKKVINKRSGNVILRIGGGISDTAINSLKSSVN